MKHIQNTKLNEKKLNLYNKDILEENINNKEISKEHMDKVLEINNEILEVFTKNKCTVRETVTILSAMLESIYAYSILKDFGYKE